MATDNKSRSQPLYELLYHPGIPGRGEFIRLVLEATGVPYKDVSNESEDGTSPPSSNLKACAQPLSLHRMTQVPDPSTLSSIPLP